MPFSLKFPVPGHETDPDDGLLATADGLHGPLAEHDGNLGGDSDLGLEVVCGVGDGESLGLDGGLLDDLDLGLGGGHGLSLFRVVGGAAWCSRPWF